VIVSIPTTFIADNLSPALPLHPHANTAFQQLYHQCCPSQKPETSQIEPASHLQNHTWPDPKDPLSEEPLLTLTHQNFVATTCTHATQQH